ncbi:MAG: hypothetical protein RL304_1025, partial [Verrucomicrobiota bacterium]
MPAGAGRGSLGVEPRAEAQAEFGHGAGGAVAEG